MKQAIAAYYLACSLVGDGMDQTTIYFTLFSPLIVFESTLTTIGQEEWQPFYA